MISRPAPRVPALVAACMRVSVSGRRTIPSAATKQKSAADKDEACRRYFTHGLLLPIFAPQLVIGPQQKAGQGDGAQKSDAGIGDGHIQIGFFVGIDGESHQKCQHQHRKQIHGHHAIGGGGPSGQAPQHDGHADRSARSGLAGIWRNSKSFGCDHHRVTSSTRRSSPSLISSRDFHIIQKHHMHIERGAVFGKIDAQGSGRQGNQVGHQKISRSVRASKGTPMMPGRLICLGVITSHSTADWKWPVPLEKKTRQVQRFGKLFKIARFR
jgi:hypothetical protein